MQKALGTLLGLFLFIWIVSPAIVHAQSWKLVWSEEFNYTGKPDPGVWEYEKGYVRNNEAQYYQEDNAWVDGNKLIITARRNDNGHSYTSSSIRTRNKWDFLFGKVEMRGKIPISGGSWPAWWTLGYGAWPDAGECDIMEYYRGKVLANFYDGNRSWDSYTFPVDDAWASQYHTWVLEWDENLMSIYCDGELLNTYDPQISREAFLNPQYMIVNLALGGNNGGAIDDSKFPLEYEVDYIRYYLAVVDIVPYLQVNDGTWQQAASVTVESGDKVKFGPQPISGGTWRWSGAVSGTSREQTFYPTSSTTATASFTKDGGAVSTQVFTVMVEGGDDGDFDPTASYKIVSRNSSKVLTIGGSDINANAAPIQQYSDAGATYQRWRVVENSDGYYSIISIASGQYFDINGASTADGAINIQWPENGGDNQDWSIVDQGNGYYHIISRNSGKLLDIEGASTADGAQSLQWRDNGGYNQDWRIIAD